MKSHFVAVLRVFAATILLAACATPQIPGNYEGTLQVGRDLERRVRVKLEPNGRAAVSTARWGSFSYLAEGAWKRANNSMIIVDLTSPNPQRIVFQHSGDLLIAKEWDRSVWGGRGPGVLQLVR
ncbi:MAG TPA: hypothetical protein VEU32_14845 [Burkholderiales bacterium]|nr:hypothetical protein [Burkholderiales bacterium]